MLNSSTRGYVLMSVLLSGLIVVAGFQWMKQEVKMKACDVDLNTCARLEQCVVVRPCKCLDEFCPVCDAPDTCEVR